MTKAEMEKLLIEKYGYEKSDLRDDKGNPLKNSVLEDMIADEETEEEKAEESTEEDDVFALNETVFEARHNLKDDDLILCMSGVSGELRFESELSNFRITTRGFGQTMKIPYKDLRYVHNLAPQAFEQGDILVLNQSIQEEFGLSSIYKKVVTPKNVHKVLRMDAEELKKFISDMPRGLKVSLYDEARKLYQAGKIDSISTVRVIEEEYGVSLEDNAPISDTIMG